MPAPIRAEVVHEVISVIYSHCRCYGQTTLPLGILHANMIGVKSERWRISSTPCANPCGDLLFELW